MQKFAKISVSLIILLITPYAIAQNDTIRGSTTCYVIKNDKLQSQSKCSYSGTAEFAGNGGTQTANFYLQGNKNPIKVSQSVVFGSPNDGEYLLNGKSSVNFWRLKSNFKKASEKQKDKILSENDGIKKFISCLQDKNTRQEFCYAADSFGNF